MAERDQANGLAGGDIRPPKQLLPEFPPLPEQMKAAFPDMATWEERMNEWVTKTNFILNGDNSLNGDTT